MTLRRVLAWVAAAILPLHLSYGQATGLKFASDEQLRGVPLASRPYSGDRMPTSADLSGRFPPVGFQGRQNSCVGWATAYALKSFQECLEENHPPCDGSGNINADAVFSPAFIYNQINNGADGGCSFVDALNLLSQTGAATLRQVPYNDTDFRTRPGADVIAAAARYRIDTWRRVNVVDISEVKAQIVANMPVLIGAVVDEGFMAKRGTDIWRVAGEPKGGHAMVVVGYDDGRRAFKLLNSWGRQWGDNGYGWIDYDLFPRVVHEGFVAKDALNGPNPSPSVPQVPTPQQPQEVIQPPAPAAAQSEFALSQVTHNVPHPQFGQSMRFDGTFAVPARSGRVVQIVVRFYWDAGGGRKGYLVGGTTPQFFDSAGCAATGAPPTAVPAEGLRASWYAFMPNTALVAPWGGWQWTATQNGWQQVYTPYRSSLLAEAQLFMDGMCVCVSPAVPFVIAR